MPRAIHIVLAVLLVLVGLPVMAERAVSFTTRLTQLQPALTPLSAEVLASAFVDAGQAHGFDPRFLAAISFRESSYNTDILELRRFGGDVSSRYRKDIGLMQVRGAALRFRPEACPVELRGIWCQIETGTRYLKHMRDVACPGSRWRYLAAYGTGVCMSEREATHNKGVKNVMRYYRRLGGHP